MKRPEIWPAPPVIGVWIAGAEITSLSSTMASGRPTILRRRLAEALRAADVEAEIDDRLVGALSKAGCASVRSPPSTMTRRSTGTRWPPASRDGQQVDVGRARLRQHAELELGGLAEDLLQPLRILQARHLDEDAVGALALDVRLGRAERVDAAADDLDRLIDGAADPLVDAGVGIGELDQPVRRGR